VLLSRRYESTFPGEWLYTLHNRYLLVAGRTGIGGLGRLPVVFSPSPFAGAGLAKRRDRFLSPLALGFTAALLAKMVHMAVDIFNSPQIRFCGWLPLSRAMSRIEAPSPRRAE